MEGSDDAEEPRQTSDFGEDLEKAVPANKSKAFMRCMKATVYATLLL